jgi:CubicO group peptidase (beta-lactamase class C family)
LDKAIALCREAFQVPGLSVAVVKEGKVVLSKGYGVRKVGDPAPVTARTLFQIASNTKLFTAVALATLVDAGRLDWNDRVVDRLPGFQMSDPYVTREMRIRDLLCHSSGLGLGAGDLLFYPGTDLKAEDLLFRLRHIPLAHSFRSTYAYDNILYTVAGAVIKAVGGQSWEETVQEGIFARLGMTGSRTGVTALRTGDEVAAAHAAAEGGPRVVAYSALDNSAPGGAILSNAEDLSKWLLALLKGGSPDSGRRLVSEAQAEVLETPLTLVPVPKPMGPIRESFPTLAAYAMGTFTQDYRGEHILTHSGGVAGMVSRVTRVPKRNLGIAVITNSDSVDAYAAVMYTLLDHYLGLPPKDWTAAFLELKSRREAEGLDAQKRAGAQRDLASHPSLPIAAYGGRYRDAWYGDVFIEAKGDHLALRFSHTPSFRGDLTHWQQDTFIARWPDRTLNADAYVTFSLNPDGTVREVRMQPVSPLTDFSYDFQDLVLKPVRADAPPY